MRALAARLFSHTMLVAAGAGLLVGALAAEPATASSSTEGKDFPGIGDVRWGPEIRVTDIEGTKSSPQLRATDTKGEYVLWRSNGPGIGTWLARVGADGSLLQEETFLTNHQVSGWGYPYLQGPYVDADRAGDLHVVWEWDYLSIYYEKLDADGYSLVGPQRVSANDQQASHEPSLTVGQNGSVHIVHEDYRWQCEDIFYYMQDGDGKTVISQQVVTSDISAHAEFAMAKPDPNSGATYIVLGSSTGTLIERFDNPFNRNMRSVKVRNQTDDHLVDFAVTSDGVIHAAWTENSTVYYSRVNRTGAVTRDHAILSTTANYGATAGFARVAALRDNRAVVVWSDNATGSPQITASFVDTDSFGAAGTPPVATITASGGRATDPWVEVDPEGDLHLAWIDTRDGRTEVYYRDALACRVAVTVDGAAEDALQTLRPGASLIVPVQFAGRGQLWEPFDIGVGIGAAAAARGWSATLDFATTPELGQGEVFVANLTVRSPLNATDNDTAAIELTADSPTARSCFGATTVQARVHVQRAFSVEIGPALQNASNGEKVTFDVSVRNGGDAREDLVLLNVTATDARWGVALYLEGAAIDPGGRANGTLTVLVPSNRSVAPAHAVLEVRVQAASSVDPRYKGSATAKVVVIPDVHLQLISLDTPATLLPGGHARFTFHLLVEGNAEPLVSIFATEPALDARRGSAPYTLSFPEYIVAFGEVVSLTLDFTAPEDVPAGAAYVFTVSASADDAESASAQAYAFITRVCDFSVEAGSASVSSGGTDEFQVTVSNRGNYDDEFAVEVSGLAEGWWANATPEAPLTFPVAAGGSAREWVLVGAPLLAPAGPQGVAVTARSKFCGLTQVSALVLVLNQTGFRMSVESESVNALPGGEAVFKVLVESTANLPQVYRFEGSALPPERAGWLGIVATPGASLSGRYLSMGPFATAKLLLHVPITQNTTLAAITVTLSALGPSGGPKMLALLVNILHPDVRVVDVGIDGGPFHAGDSAVISVTLENQGGADAPVLGVWVTVDGVRIASIDVAGLATGENRTLRFNWTALEGDHTVAVEVRSEGGAREIEMRNNRADETLTVQPPLPPSVVEPQAEGGAPWALLLVLAAAIAFVFAALRSRRSRGE